MFFLMFTFNQLGVLSLIGGAIILSTVLRQPSQKNYNGYRILAELKEVT